MNLIALTPVDAGFAIYQEGQPLTLPNAEALALVKTGAAKPADRRARRFVEEANAIEKHAQTLLDSQPMDPDIARAQRNQNSGAVQSLGLRGANRHSSNQAGSFNN